VAHGKSVGASQRTVNAKISGLTLAMDPSDTAVIGRGMQATISRLAHHEGCPTSASADQLRGSQ
jgi:hypothetical protein